MAFLVLPCYSFLIAWENIKKILFFILWIPVTNVKGR
jgi:hypothetical protein